MAVKTAQNLSSVQQNAPRQKLEWSVDYFAGIDTTSDPASSSSSPNAMLEEASPDTLNTVFDKVQSCGSRKGYSKLLTTSLTNFIGGMYPLYQSTGAKQLIYGSGNALYKYNNAGGSTQLSGTPATFTPNQQWDFDELLDNVYAGNGTDSLIQYNGTSYTIANAGVTPQYVKVHKNRVYAVNKNSSILYFSDAGAPTSWPVNNFIQINTNDGQNITGVNDILDNLVIFKDESVWILTGEPLGAGNLTTIGNLQLKQANSSVGCSAFRTICKIQQSLVFMHYSGIYILQNTSVTPVSPFLKGTFQNMSSAFLNLSYAVFNPLENKYILGYPSAAASKPDSTIVWDLVTKQYTLWDDIPGNCAVNYRFSGLTESVLIGDPNKGNIYEMFQGYADIFGDNGTATGGSSSTLVDSTKSWTPNIATDARVKIVSGTSTGSEAVVSSNTSTTLTVGSWSAGAPDNTSVYSIGWYDSYWVTKNSDLDMTGYVKKFRFFNFFIDAESYPILFGTSIDFQPLAYQKPLNLSSGALDWGQSGLNWGVSSGNWGTFSSEFAQANIGNTGRFIQAKFGNNLANQPWRVIKYSISYKLKKLRANIVTT